MQKHNKYIVIVLSIISVISFVCLWILYTYERSDDLVKPNRYPYRLSVENSKDYVNFSVSDIDDDNIVDKT